MSQIAGPIWISTDFLSWDPTPIEMGYGSRNERQESYDLFDHAEYVLERHPDDGEYRADAIVNLNRAIKTRIGHLMKVHELSSHPVYLQMKKKVWGSLQYFSVLRPRLIQGLTDTRNGIEHHGISAPGLAKTLDMLENTWYFLKATDFLAGRPNSGIQFVDGPKTENRITIDIGPGKWTTPAVSGIIDLHCTSETPDRNAMKVVLDREESPEERLDRAHIEEFQGIKLQPNTANLDESYIYFIGHAKLDLHLTETLTRMRFSETLEPSPGDTA